MSDQPIPDGGSAFPGQRVCEYTGKLDPVAGMSLHDYYVGQAIVAIFLETAHRDCDIRSDDDFRHAAKKAHDLADAIIAEKQRREGGDS